MKYNFDEIIERGHTDSIKWSKKRLKEDFGAEDSVPMWIADMDFKAAPPIVDAVVKRAKHGVYGYGHKTDEFLDAVVDWQQKRNGWTIQKDWILFTPGIIPALNFILESFCNPGDKVIIQSPVYYPFANIINNNGLHIANNPLILKNGSYEVDFEQLESIARDGRVKVMILCNPHNPVGRVWTEDELTKMGEICIRNNVLVVTDEIHSDLIYPPHRHVPFAKLSEKFRMNAIVCTSPSKTFNLAGLQLSNIIVPNIKLRRELYHKISTIDIDPGSFATVAQIAAYNHGEEWLEQLLIYLQKNLDFMEEFLAKRLPRVRMTRPEATYLAWLDFSDYGLTDAALREWMQKKAKVAMDDGFIFGAGGEQFQRINFACPKSMLKKALERIADSLDEIV